MIAIISVAIPVWLSGFAVIFTAILSSHTYARAVFAICGIIFEEEKKKNRRGDGGCVRAIGIEQLKYPVRRKDSRKIAVSRARRASGFSVYRTPAATFPHRTVVSRLALNPLTAASGLSAGLCTSDFPWFCSAPRFARETSVS